MKRLIRHCVALSVCATLGALPFVYLPAALADEAIDVAPQAPVMHVVEGAEDASMPKDETAEPEAMEADDQGLQNNAIDIQALEVSAPGDDQGLLEVQEDVDDQAVPEIVVEDLVSADSGGEPVVSEEAVGDERQVSVALSARSRMRGGSWGAWQVSPRKGVTLGNGRDDVSAIALKLALQNIGGDIRYRAYVANKGWQDWRTAPAVCGTGNKNLEAIRIELTGEVAKDYDIYYRTRVRGKGWQGWTKNGGLAGSAGLSRSIVALKVKVVKKGETAPAEGNAFIDAGLTGQAHVQRIGWQDQKSGYTITLGTTKRGLRMEAFRVNRPQNDDISGSIVYRAHVQKIGWQEKRKNGQLAGTEGRGLRIEALRMSLTGALGKKYDVWYRLHVQGIGWMGWAKNGKSAGTEGFGLRVEAIQVALANKGASMASGAGDCSTPFLSSTSVAYASMVGGAWQGYRTNGGVAGTTGASRAVEAIRMKGGVSYRVRRVGGGWTGWGSKEAQLGSKGSKVEALQVKLRGTYAKYFDVWYRAHVSGYGWLGWTRNGNTAGSDGLGRQLEAFQVKLVAKGGAAPGSIQHPRVYPVSGNRRLDTILNKIYQGTGTSGMTSLRRAYDYVSGPGFSYRSGNKWPAGDWSTWSKDYAIEFYEMRSGNCYRFASLMCWLARGMGYDASVIAGQVVTGSGLLPHGWVEIRANGTRYVVDPDLQQEIPSRDFFWKTYSTSPAIYYNAQGVELT